MPGPRLDGVIFQLSAFNAAPAIPARAHPACRRRGGPCNRRHTLGRVILRVEHVEDLPPGRTGPAGICTGPSTQKPLALAVGEPQRTQDVVAVELVARVIGERLRQRRTAPVKVADERLVARARRTGLPGRAAGCVADGVAAAGDGEGSLRVVVRKRNGTFPAA